MCNSLIYRLAVIIIASCISITGNAQTNLDNTLAQKEKELQKAWLAFAAEAETPQMQVNRFRNFARFVSNMTFRENQVKLAEQEYLQAAKQSKISDSLPTQPANTKWASQYWNDIKKEVGSKEIEKISQDYTKAISQSSK